MQDEITLVVEDQDSEDLELDGQKGWRDPLKKHLTELKEVRLSAAELEQKMANFLELVGRLFQKAEQQTQQQPGLQLTEIELSVEISGEGEVKLIAGGKASGKGAIKLKFTRVEPQ